jgi:pimeloyl-ACP methyl ester carboxylesterase
MNVTAASETVQVGETAMHFLKGGNGRPAVFLHGVEGPEGWLAIHEALAANATVYAPAAPGFGETPRPEWAESISHLALLHLWFLQAVGLRSVDLIGAGVGGWIAAEMAVMCPDTLAHLVLVDAAGVRPREGEIADIFVMPWSQVINRSFHDAAVSSEYERVYAANPIQDFGGPREAGRSMAMRTCYRPYMHNPALLPMLARVDVPSLIVWGDDDQIVPVECGRIYQGAIPGARLEIIEDCGHFAHFERPDELSKLIREFVA